MLPQTELRVPRRNYRQIENLVSRKTRAPEGQTAGHMLSELIFATQDDPVSVVFVHNQLCSYGILGYRVAAAADEQQFGLPHELVVPERTILSVDALAMSDTCFVRYQQIDEEDEPVDGELDLPSGFYERCDWTVTGAFTDYTATTPTAVHELSIICETEQGLVYGFAEQKYTVRLPDGRTALFCPSTMGLLHPGAPCDTWQLIQTGEEDLIVEGVYYWATADNFQDNLSPAPATVGDILASTMIANFKKENGELLIVLENIANTGYAKQVMAGKFARKPGHCKPGPDPFDPSDFEEVIKLRLLSKPVGGIKRTPSASASVAAPKRQKSAEEELPKVDAEKVFGELSALSALYTYKDVLTTEQLAQIEQIAAAISAKHNGSTSLFKAVEENSRQRLEAAKKQLQMISQHMAGGMPLVNTSATLEAVQAAITEYATALSTSGFPSVGCVEMLAQELGKLEALDIGREARTAAAKVLQQLMIIFKQCNLAIGAAETAFSKCAAAGITIQMPDMAPKRAAEVALASLHALMSVPDSDVGELVQSVEVTGMRVRQLLQLKDGLIATKKEVSSRLEKVLKDLLK